MNDYEKFEKECIIIRGSNNKLLDEFESWLEATGLSDNTISIHFSNIDFYIDEFLLYYKPIRPEDSVNSVSMFLGDWLIKKTMWSSPSSVKSNARSLKKFYSFMLSKGLIKNSELDDLKKTIKREMPKWLEKATKHWE